MAERLHVESPAVIGAPSGKAEVWSLRGAMSFDEMRHSGRSIKRGGLVVRQSAGVTECPVQLGMIVSKTVGNAVVRNRLRRQIRSVVRELAPQLVGSKVVVRALPGAAGASFESLAASLRFCLIGTASEPAQ